MLERIPRRLVAPFGFAMVLAGLVLILWLLTRLPLSGQGNSAPTTGDEPAVQLLFTATPAQEVPPSPPTPPSTSTPPTRQPPTVIALADALPVEFVQAVIQLADDSTHLLLASTDAPTGNAPTGNVPTATLRLDW